jgi:hypothetical protein
MMLMGYVAEHWQSCGLYLVSDMPFCGGGSGCLDARTACDKAMMTSHDSLHGLCKLLFCLEL